MSCEQAQELPIPDLIRARRKAAGFRSQEALAAALGTNRVQVNVWETGRHFPSEESAVKLARVIGGDPHDYHDGDGRSPRRRDEEVALEMTRLLTDQLAALADTNRQILELLAQIRDSVAPQASD